MSEQQPLPSPWALWTVFEGFPQWFLARGYPPTLRDPRRWVRALRVTLLIAVLTLIAACGCELISWSSLFWGRYWWIHQLPFGVFVLLPLSRWMGRPWRRAMLAVPFAMAAYPVIIEFRASSAGAWIHADRDLFYMAWGVLISVGVLWPTTFTSWLVVVLCGFIAALGAELEVYYVHFWRSHLVDLYFPRFSYFVDQLFREYVRLFCVSWALAACLWDPPRE